MKKFRRLAALLLAGAMALMVFTGCSNSAFEREVENEIMKQFNALRSTLSTEETTLPELQNDTSLYATALQMLDKIDPDSSLINEPKTYKDIFSFKDGKQSEATFVVVTREGMYIGWNSIAQEFTADTLKTLNIWDVLHRDPEESYDVDWLKSITAFTVAARTINGRTYVAYGYTYSMSPT